MISKATIASVLVSAASILLLNLAPFPAYANDASVGCQHGFNFFECPGGVATGSITFGDFNAATLTWRQPDGSTALGGNNNTLLACPTPNQPDVNVPDMVVAPPTPEPVVAPPAAIVPTMISPAMIEAVMEDLSPPVNFPIVRQRYLLNADTTLTIGTCTFGSGVSGGDSKINNRLLNGLGCDYNYNTEAFNIKLDYSGVQFEEPGSILDQTMTGTSSSSSRPDIRRVPPEMLDAFFGDDVILDGFDDFGLPAPTHTLGGNVKFGDLSAGSFGSLVEGTEDDTLSSNSAEPSTTTPANSEDPLAAFANLFVIEEEPKPVEPKQNMRVFLSEQGNVDFEILDLNDNGLRFGDTGRSSVGIDGSGNAQNGRNYNSRFRLNIPGETDGGLQFGGRVRLRDETEPATTNTPDEISSAENQGETDRANTWLAGATAAKARLGNAIIGGNEVTESEGTHFIKDTRNIFLNPAAVNEYKNYVVTEWGASAEARANDAEANEEGGFFREAGSFAYGVYLGNRATQSSTERNSEPEEFTASDFSVKAFVSTDEYHRFLRGEAGLEYGASITYGTGIDKARLIGALLSDVGSMGPGMSIDTEEPGSIIDETEYVSVIELYYDNLERKNKENGNDEATANALMLSVEEQAADVQRDASNVIPGNDLSFLTLPGDSPGVRAFSEAMQRNYLFAAAICLDFNIYSS